MRHSYLALASAVAVLTFAQVGFAAPGVKPKKASKPASALSTQVSEMRPEYAAPPAWVSERPVPASNPKRKDDAFEMLLANSQERLTPEGLENFVEYAVLVRTQAGVQAFGNVVIPWNVYRTDLTIHRASIERDGKSIDVLDRNNVSIIRREAKLEQSTMTGLRTAVMPVRGLEVGDTLRVAFTYKTNGTRVGKTEEIQDFAPPVPITSIYRRFLLSPGMPARWSIDPGIKPTSTNETPDGTERIFTLTNYEPAKNPKFVPDRLSRRLIQVSTFQNWGEVAAVMTPGFTEARKTADNSEVAKLAQEIAAKHKDPHDRLLAALRFSQDRIRYVALLLNDGDYSSMTADEVWAQRFGDCKGKTSFLLALLDRLGIQAEPMLAAVRLDDGLERQLPTLAMFDHVLVRAHVDGQVYYLDGTSFGQRTLEELRQSPVQNGLPLVANATLTRAADIMPAAPLVESSLTWDARQGVLGEVPFEATLTLRGSAAADMRATSALSTDREKFVEGLKSKINGVANEDLELESANEDMSDGSFLAKFKGKAEMDWTPVDGLKGNRFAFSQSTLVWDGEFDRTEDHAKDFPVAMTFPYWERTVEKILLPNNGRDFSLDAKGVDEEIAVTRMSRSVSFVDGVATSMSDFRRLKREMDPDTARAAKSPLDDIGDSFAYVVSRKKLKTD